MSFDLTANLVDLHNRAIYVAKVTVEDATIVAIERLDTDGEKKLPFLMPGFVDAHIHVESSMLLPSEFARIAVQHGTVATISDPHEIANVCGIEGIELMLQNAAQVTFKFMFGAPSCVPATPFETAGAALDSASVTKLLSDDRIGYLSEVMDFPGVLRRDAEVMAKIEAAKKAGKPVDGHAPGLRGQEAADYIAAGISTDHECFTLEEALDKIAAGGKIAIREGSAARNFDALVSLIDSHPQQCMLCSDDKHPDEFLLGHINLLAARAVAAGCDLMKVLTVACLNPVEHYGLKVGTLRVGDPADFITVVDLENFEVLSTYINGQQVFGNSKCLIPSPPTATINQFVASPITKDQLAVKADTEAETQTMAVIGAIDGQLITHSLSHPCKIESGLIVSDVERDILKIVVVNRYQRSAPAIAFIQGFGLKSGALASSVAHDSHNIIAVGVSDDDITAAINGVIETEGGLSFSAADKTEVLPLPVAGLMAVDPCEVVAAKYTLLDNAAKASGTTLRAPYMTLSFMALLVIPSLKLSDRGLFDGDKFQFVSVIADQ